MWNYLRSLFARVALLFAWLIVFGATLELPVEWAILVGMGALGAFLWIHAWLRWPGKERWDYGQLGWGQTRGWGLLLILSVILVLGDIGWIIYRDALDLSAEEDPISFAVLAVLAFPVVEEFGFRLWIQNQLDEKLPTVVALGLVSLAFAKVHGNELPISQFLSAGLYGTVLVMTRSIWPSVILYAFHNVSLFVIEQLPRVKSTAIALAEHPPPYLPAGVIGSWSLAVGQGVLWWWAYYRLPGHAPTS